MKCPKCNKGIQDLFKEIPLTNYPILYDGSDNVESYSIGITEYSVKFMSCPICDELLIKLIGRTLYSGAETYLSIDEFIYPPINTDRKCPIEVNHDVAADFNEACAVLKLSPKASAALSRRCLQNILVSKGGVNAKDNLYKQLEQIKVSLPSYLSNCIDGIRHFGNFSAHATRDLSTNQIIPVEVGEADWLLNILENLMDFYYVQPKKIENNKKALNQKLKAAGKSLMD